MPVPPRTRTESAAALRPPSGVASAAIPALDRTQGGAARDGVYSALREAITSASLKPGQRLSENELAGHLGVSRTPVREALARLRDERLVAIVPQLGTFVTRISPDGVAAAVFVREALECAAIRLTTERAAAADVAGLQANLARQEAAQAAGDERAFDGLDEELHHTLCDLSGFEIAWGLSRRANGHLDRLRRLSIPDPAYLGEMVAEHRDVVEAVAAGDPDAAERALRHHLRMVTSGLPTLRERHPEFFE